MRQRIYVAISTFAHRHGRRTPARCGGHLWRYPLERWKQRHPDAAGHLAVDDVLVDAMRGRSTTWTRIRVNLRNVPEEKRPPQETPDPDDDPTREWRAAVRKGAPPQE